MRPQLLFVYNADSGLFNTVTDIAHKLLSPSTYACNLCALTHGHFTVREHWVEYLKTLDAECTFLHRDEFHAQYGCVDIPLPAIFELAANEPTLFVDAATLNACTSLEQLTDILTGRLRRGY